MPKDPSVNKRVKRHVIGREHRFYVATAPALTDLCRAELGSLLGPDHSLQARPGGIEFSGRLTDAYRLNLLARFPNRILMHMAAFKATNFRRLEQKLAAIAWDLYLYRGSPLKIRVNTHKCRLYHTTAVVDIVRNQVQSHLEQYGLPTAADQNDDQVQQLFIRGKNDAFSVAIDSSGEHLYKRGIKTHGGRAPLRENLAAAALQLAGYDGREPLIDPMCGSGTFSLEAALIAANIPPGWYRKFAFMEWPSFLEKRWRFLRKKSETAFRQCGSPMILASDIDGAACEALSRSLKQNNFEGWVSVVQKNFFETSPEQWTGDRGVIVLNPPYGRRLTTAAGEAELDKIFKYLTRFYKGWRLALISPRKSLDREFPFEIKTHSIAHGGLAAAVAVGKIT